MNLSEKIDAGIKDLKADGYNGLSKRLEFAKDFAEKHGDGLGGLADDISTIAVSKISAGNPDKEGLRIMAKTAVLTVIFVGLVVIGKKD